MNKVRRTLSKLILQFNTRIGRNHYPQVAELTRELSLSMEDVRDGVQVPAEKYKVVAITGKTENLIRLSDEMLRYPSVKVKKVS